jgi:glycine/D-amino acid oxidase-like deaminating enzyme
MADKRHIIVIGGGIIGASIAWHLVRAGAAVTLIAGRLGGVATPTSFAWINASWGNPEPYFRLRTRSMREWKRLAAEVPGTSLSWCGGLCWDLPREELEAYAREHGGWGYGINAVSAGEIAAIEPSVASPPDYALHVREEGAAEPAEAARAMIADARARGLRVIEGREVTGLVERGGVVTGVRLSEEVLDADMVVLASGATVPDLVAPLGITVPIEAPPGLIVHSKPVPPMLTGLVLAPELHVRQTAEGRIIAGSDFAGTDPGEDAEGAARDLFAKVRAFLKGGERLEMEFHTVGYRPTPKDGFPILGAAEGISGLYLAVTHSGVTLAPAVGLFAAQEILTGDSEPLLAPYRLSRFGSA